MSENQHENEFTGNAAKVASELLALSGRRSTQSEDVSREIPPERDHIGALEKFKARPRQSGSLSDQEMDFLKWNIKEAARAGEDPKAQVEHIIQAYRPNDIQAQMLRNSITKSGVISPEEMSYRREQINNAILTGSGDPTEEIHSIAEGLNDTQKLILLDYLNQATDMAAMGHESRGKHILDESSEDLTEKA